MIRRALENRPALLRLTLCCAILTIGFAAALFAQSPSAELPSNSPTVQTPPEPSALPTFLVPPKTPTLSPPAESPENAPQIPPTAAPAEMPASPQTAPTAPPAASAPSAEVPSAETSPAETKTAVPTEATPDTSFAPVEKLLDGPESWVGSSGITSTVKMVALLTIFSIAPAILIMTTSFVRIMTVLSILRQAIGTGQIPPTQILTALAMFLTLLIMTPVWSEVWTDAIKPYSEEKITANEAFDRGGLPIRTFLWKQIERTGNTDSIWLFMRYVPDAAEPKFYEEIPWRALLPAFVLSELKTAFLIGFQLFLPFLIIDLVVSGVMVSAGMMMLPPSIVALPFKLMLFVLTDGWTLVVKMLLESFSVGS